MTAAETTLPRSSGTSARGKTDQPLALSEEQFRMLVNGVKDYAIFMLDPQGIVATWNPGAERIKGYTAEEIIGRHFSTFYTEEDRQADKATREIRIATDTGHYEEEGWRVRKDGSRFWANVVLTALRDADGTLRGFAKVTRDLSERRRAEEQLRQSEERFRLLVSGVTDYAIFMLDATGHVMTWNAGAERIKGYRADEIIGRHFSCFYMQEDLAAGKTDMELEVASREGKYVEEGWRLRKDGSRFWASVVITVVRGADGQLRGFSKVTRDVTERRESERIRSIVDNVADGIVTFDENGVIESFNPAAEKIFGYEAEEMLGTGIRRLAPDREEVDWAMQSTEPGVKEVNGLRRDGQVFPMDLAVRPFQFQGRRAYTAVVRDITERRKAQDQLRYYAQQLQESNAELARSNQELDDFAYIASHDLKEPLRGIHNYANFLLEDYAERLDDDGKSKLHTLTRLAQRMETLIDSLLHFSRVGRVELSNQQTDLNQLLSDTLEALQITLQEQHVKIRVPQKLPTLRCDRVRVGEVLQNLITNAVKYNDKPEKWIEIGVQESSSGAPVLYVRDNGIGIAARHQDAVFRIFKRLHGRDKYGGGTGVGLTIVKKIIERHGGHIWVESAEGEGTTFYFTLAAEAAT
jgi:PAS domain S-box-containing protein